LVADLVHAGDIDLGLGDALGEFAAPLVGILAGDLPRQLATSTDNTGSDSTATRRP
jgi:hypothetical protein